MSNALLLHSRTMNLRLGNAMGHLGQQFDPVLGELISQSLSLNEMEVAISFDANAQFAELSRLFTEFFPDTKLQLPGSWGLHQSWRFGGYSHPPKVGQPHLLATKG